MKPVCCNRNGTPYRKPVPDLFSQDKATGKWRRTSVGFIEGFRCRKCGRWHLPFIPPLSPEELSRQEAEMERIRLEGIEFDNSSHGMLLAALMSDPPRAIVINDL